MRWRRRTDEDFSEEIEAHLELETDRLIADGMSAGDARDAARRSFGSVVAAQERFHEASRWVWLEQTVQDVRYACRTLRRSPAFLATAVATLAVGLGLVTALFTIFNAYVLRPFAVRDPYSLHQIIWRAQDAGGRGFRWRDYEELRGRHDLFRDVLAETTHEVTWNRRPVVALFVSGTFFDVLAPRLRLGRGLAPFDAAAPGASPVVVLSDEGWARMFDRDPHVLGREVVLNGERLVVAGVLRPEFSGLDDTPRDLFLPITMFGRVAKIDLFGRDQPREVGLVTRLRADVTGAQAEAALAAFAARATDRRDAVRVEARQIATPNPLTIELAAVLSPVFAAFLLVLVAACANVSNIMLARAAARQREIAMRLSLGASRGRVVRQLMTEGLLIALLAGVAGLALAALALRAGTAAFVAGLPSSIVALVRLAPLDFDHRVFLFALSVAASATLMFALAPALRGTRVGLMHALRGQPGAAGGGSRLRGALVVSQVTVSLVLLVAAATLVRNGMAIGGTRLGFDTTGVISVTPRRQVPGQIARAAEALRREAAVGALAAASRTPLSEQLPKMPIVSSPGASVVPTSYTFASPEYFSILRIPIVHGRGFTDGEAGAEAPVAIVSAAGARALWPGADPIGRSLKVRIELVDLDRGDTTQAERQVDDADTAVTFDVVVVGVAGDAVSGLMVQGVDPSHVYLPTSAAGAHARNLLLRGHPGHDLRLDAVQSVLERVHEDPLAFQVVPVEELREANLFPLKAASWIGSLLGSIALALSVSGLYGVLTYTVGQRTREIGIRMALGATGAAVVRLVMGQSARLAGLGAAVGLVLAFGVLRVLSAVIELRNVSVLDAGAFATALALVAAATALAAFVPARRATRVDPAETLRAEA